MEQMDAHETLARFNNLYKEMDDIYHSLARHYGLSDCAFWILYTVREGNTPYTQSQLCEMMSLSKQTVNSALKTLAAAGYIALEPVAGNQKSKEIRLTLAGERLAGQTTDRVVEMERRAFGQFTGEERALLFRLLERYVGRLEAGARAILDRRDSEGCI